MPNHHVSKPLWALCSAVKAVRAELLHTYVLDAGSVVLVVSTLVVCRSCLTFCVTTYARLRIYIHMYVYTIHTHYDDELHLGIVLAKAWSIVQFIA
jgi:hypothetical protein